MDKLRLLLWLAVMAAAVLQVCCQEDKGKGGVLEIGPTKKVMKGCITGIVHDCNIPNLNLKCRQKLQGAENGGAECPPEIEPLDPNKPPEVGIPCDVGAWGPCEELPGYPGKFRTRAPTNPSADLTTCDDLIEPCNGVGQVQGDCVMTQWSSWYTYGDDNEIKVRVRFVLIPAAGGQECPHDIEACIYGPYGSWIPYSNGCYRLRTGTGYPATAVCYPQYDIKDAPCTDPCEPWGPWTAWAHVPNTNSPCYESRSRTSQGCVAPDVQTRVCVCYPWNPFGPWITVGSNPCTQTRTRTSPTCSLTESESQNCPCEPWNNWVAWTHDAGSSPCTQSRTRWSPSCSRSDTETRDCACEPWNNWVAWTHDAGSSPCTQSRTRWSPSCSRSDSETRDCVCIPWNNWTAWNLLSVIPCKQRRTRTSPTCPITDSATRDCVCIPWNNWTPWTLLSVIPCRRRRTRTSPTCPRIDDDTINCDCAWSGWSGWSTIPGTNPCEQGRTRTSSICPSETQRRDCPCPPWSPWSASGWSSGIGTNPCTQSQTVTRNRAWPCQDVENIINERPCPPCQWGDWTEWAVADGVSPCVQRRQRNGPPCQPITEERDCISSCPLAPPGEVNEPGKEVLETSAGPSDRRKRDDPWCEESKWIIYGRSDGCMAVVNATWYHCESISCQNCVPQPGTSLLCVQDKFTKIAVPLLCPNGSQDVMAVTRAMACSCYEVRDTCDKFNGPCA